MTYEKIIISAIEEGEEVTFREGSIHDAPTVMGVIWVDCHKINLSFDEETRLFLKKVPQLKKYIPSWMHRSLGIETDMV